MSFKIINWFNGNPYLLSFVISTFQFININFFLKAGKYIRTNGI